MKCLRFCLTFALALLLLGSGAWLPAGRSAAQESPAPAQPPAGLSSPDWQAIQAQVVKLTAADGQTGDHFGFSVAVDGDTAVVGALWADPGGHVDQGAAYVFCRNRGGPDAWGQVVTLIPADGAAGDTFGCSVSVDGDTAIVGAWGADVGSHPDQGAAYVYYRDQGGPDAWGQVAKLTSADGAAIDNFGDHLSVDGDTALVGAPLADVGGHPNQGAAYIFYRDQGGPDVWGQVAKLVAASGAAEDWSGICVSVDGDTALVGAPLADVGGHPDQGAAYVFYRDQGGPDSWGQVATLTAADGAASDLFGAEGALEGDTILVRAWLAEYGGDPDLGAAYVFYRQGGPHWVQVAKLPAPDGAAPYVGSSVSIAGDTAVIGASTADIGGNVYQGAAFVFGRNQGGPDAWGLVAEWTAADGAAYSFFGFWVSVDGNTVLLGAPPADVGGNGEQGAAYVFYLPTLHISSILGSFSLDPYGRHLLRVKVAVHDEAHNPVGDVAVDASIWSPVGGPYARTRMTKGSTGMAVFPWGSKVPGTWQLCVDNLSKAGTTYDPGSNHVPACASWSN